ncbi:MAG: winged helix-turn-helix domain-containing protein [Candidatus Thorarchaeota archaeon]|jgi:predicted transcriptional regulator
MSKKKKKAERVKRTRYDIFAELIRVIMVYGYCPLTRAARSTNMPVDRAKESILELVDRGLLQQDDDEGSIVYSVTVRGHQYLEIYKRMAGLVGVPIPDPIIGM